MTTLAANRFVGLFGLRAPCPGHGKRFARLGGRRLDESRRGKPGGSRHVEGSVPSRELPAGFLNRRRRTQAFLEETRANAGSQIGRSSAGCQRGSRRM